MKNSHSQQLADDLMQAYGDTLRNYDCRTQAEAFERTLRHQAPRFYVSAERARNYVCPMLRGDYQKVNSLAPLRREMYHALVEVVVSLSQKRQFLGRSPHYILTFAVNEPAPRFYVGTETMRKIFRNKKHPTMNYKL